MPSYRVCPECSERLSQEARQCACGWKESGKKSVDPFHGKCTWVDGDDRCRFPGSMSHGLKGDGKFLCAFHFFNGDPIHAQRITQNSFDWDGKPESYLRMRKDFSSRAGMDVVPGSSGVREIPRSIRELVQGFRVQPPEEKAA